MNTVAWVAAGVCSGLLLIGIGVLSFRLRQRERHTHRRLRQSQQASIASVTAGVAEISGPVASDHALLTAPVSGKPAVLYRVEVKREVDNKFLKCFDERAEIPFRIEDGSGAHARIEIEQAHTNLFADVEVIGRRYSVVSMRHTYLATEVPEALRDWALAKTNRDLPDASRLRFEECRVQVGQRLSAHGPCHWARDAAGNRELVLTAAGPLDGLLSLWTMDKTTLLRRFGRRDGIAAFFIVAGAAILVAGVVYGIL